MPTELQKPMHSSMHAFCVHPRVRFDTQEADEHVILVLRAHPFTQLHWFFKGFLMVLLLIALNFVFPAFIALNQILFLNIAAVLFILAYFWLRFLLYFFSVGIITNKRVIDVDFYSILYKEVTETRILKVEDITSKTGGYFGSLFNYGNVFVQTAGTEVNIEFINVPRPADVVKIINQLHPH